MFSFYRFCILYVGYDKYVELCTDLSDMYSVFVFEQVSSSFPYFLFRRQ